MVNGAQETRNELLALLARAVLFQQQITEPLFETIGLQHWTLDLVGRQYMDFRYMIGLRDREHVTSTSRPRHLLATYKEA